MSPGRIHRLLLLVTGLAASIAILICKLPVPVQSVIWLLIGTCVYRQWHTLSLPYRLRHHGGKDDTVNHWEVRLGDGECSKGVLVKQGYRSAGLLVIVIGAENGKRPLLRIPVWKDSVTAADFSHLNLQMMFNAHKGR